MTALKKLVRELKVMEYSKDSLVNPHSSLRSS
jgi:hypothetical protein